MDGLPFEKPETVPMTPQRRWLVPLPVVLTVLGCFVIALILANAPDRDLLLLKILGGATLWLAFCDYAHAWAVRLGWL